MQSVPVGHSAPRCQPLSEGWVLNAECAIRPFCTAKSVPLRSEGGVLNAECEKQNSLPETSLNRLHKETLRCRVYYSRTTFWRGECRYIECTSVSVLETVSTDALVAGELVAVVGHSAPRSQRPDARWRGS